MTSQIDWTRVWMYVGMSLFISAFWVGSVIVVWEWVR
jgi:hypothetical protein